METRIKTASVTDNVTSQVLCKARELPVVESPLPHCFLLKFVTDPKTGCWNWTGWICRNWRYPKHAYGYHKYVDAVTGKRRSMSAHRFAYTVTHGPVPRHLDVDHLCHNKLCVNPQHLEAVSHRENIRRIPSDLRARDPRVARQAAIASWKKRRSK